MSIKNKLSRFKKHLGVQETGKTLEKHALDEGIPFLDEWENFDSKPYHFDESYSIIREVTYPIDYSHGLYSFKEIFQIKEEWKNRMINHPLSCDNHEISEMVFFDTETTGLGGGVGNTIFLIGYAQVLEDKVTVKQHFLPQAGAEVPLYQGFLTDIGQSLNLLCSYNGKAFDWPQIKTRHTLIRDAVPQLPSFGHFDLLHAARRLWKQELPSVRLSVVENEILQVQRKEDVPGYLAPMIYFDFLKDPNPEGIKGVFKHNEIDVLTLITLYIHLSKKILKVTNHNLTDLEAYEIARWFEHLKEYEIAFKCYENLVGSSKVGKQARKALAQLYKKGKNYEAAIQVWEELITESFFDHEVSIELAKTYEHRSKDIEKAYYYANLGYQWVKKKSRLTVTDKNVLKECEARLDRLTKKMK